MPVGQTVTTKVSLLNATTSPVEVSQLNVAGQNFFVNGQSNLPVTISVGNSYSFDIGFKPGGVSNYTGQFSAMDGANEQIVQVSISGIGVGASGSSSTPGLTVSAAKLAFGNVPVGTASTRSVTLTSTGIGAGDHQLGRANRSWLHDVGSHLPGHPESETIGNAECAV